MKKLACLLLLAFFFTTNLIFAEDIIKEKSISTSDGKTLYVKAGCGDIKITSWNKSEAYIKISGNDAAKEKFSFKIEEKSGDVYVTIKSKSSSFNAENLILRIEASIPENYNTDVSTAGGDISLDNLNGNIIMKTAGGNIVVKNINGTSKLLTSGGNIKVETFNGSFTAKTAGGDIEATGTNGKVDAKTAGGDIRLKFSGENEGIDAYTSGGDIKLYLNDSFAANIELKTSSGTIDLGFPFDGEMNKHASKIKGKINGGGKPVVCKTSGGDIVVSKIK